MQATKPGVQRPGTRVAIAYARQARPRFVAELAGFVRWASVSAEARHRANVARGAAWLTRHLRGIGLEHVQRVATGGHPIVTADWRHTPGAPRLLASGHYDAYSAGPAAAWTTPPFEARLTPTHLVGRDASDGKGQLWAHVKAVESWLRASGRLRATCAACSTAERRSAARLCSASCCCICNAVRSMRRYCRTYQ